MKKILRYSLLLLLGLMVLSGLFFTVRQTLANAEIEREAAAVPTSIPTLETTTRL